MDEKFGIFQILQDLVANMEIHKTLKENWTNIPVLLYSKGTIGYLLSKLIHFHIRTVILHYIVCMCK